MRFGSQKRQSQLDRPGKVSICLAAAFFSASNMRSIMLLAVLLLVLNDFNVHSAYVAGLPLQTTEAILSST